MRRSISIFSALLFLILLLGSCKKDHRLLGNEAVPESDQLSASSLEGFSVIGFSEKYDSIISLNNASKFIGSNNDGIVGKLDVGLYTNLNISVSDFDFGSSAQLVSAEIILAVSNTNLMGKFSSVINFSVYTLDSTLVTNRAYYTSNNRLHSNNLVAAAPTATTVYQGLPAIRIPIDPLYADGIMKNKAALASNTELQKAYKGFYIIGSASDEGIIYQADLSSEISGFFIRYKPSPSDTATQFRFAFDGSTAARFNTARFTPVPALATQLAGDTAAGDYGIYLKGMGGAKAKVYVPWLKNYGDTFKVAVNRAELFFYPDKTYLASLTTLNSKRYTYPPKLCLFALDSLGRETTLEDLKNVNYVSRFDGSYDTEAQRYVFNIPLHAQAILKGKLKNYGFAIAMVDSDPLYSAFRDLNQESLILQGAKSAQAPQFRIDYIRLKGE